MGFFSKKSKSKSRYSNDPLKAYAGAYMGASPWSFASLDPDATLAAMGKGTSVGTTNLGATYKAKLQGMSKEEKMQSQAGQDALARIQERQSSGQFLTEEETNFINEHLDKAFESSRNIAMQDWTKGAQQLAGGRGLRMSDTPVAQPAMNSLRDMELGFSSQRSQLGLDATLKFSANQNMFDQSLMESLNNLQFNRWNTRQGYLFGGGLQAAGSIQHTTSNSFKQGMSGLDKVMGTMKMIDTGLDLGQKIGTMGQSMSMGMGGAGGGAGVPGAANFSQMSPGGMFGGKAT